MVKKQVGMNNGRTVRGTATLELAWRRYSKGERPMRWLNSALK